MSPRGWSRWGLGLGLAAAVAHALLARESHGWLAWPGAWAVLGFAGCWLIVVASKALGSAGI